MYCKDTTFLRHTKAKTYNFLSELRDEKYIRSSALQYFD